MSEVSHERKEVIQGGQSQTPKCPKKPIDQALIDHIRYYRKTVFREDCKGYAQSMGFNQTMSQVCKIKVRTGSMQREVGMSEHMMKTNAKTGYQATSYERIAGWVDKTKKNHQRLKVQNVENKFTYREAITSGPCDTIMIACKRDELNPISGKALVERSISLVLHKKHKDDDMLLRLYKKNSRELKENQAFKTPAFYRFVSFISNQKNEIHGGLS